MTLLVTGSSPPQLPIAYDPLHILKNMLLKRKKLFKILGLKQHSDTTAAYFLAVIFHGCSAAGFSPYNSCLPLTDEVCWMQLVMDPTVVCWLSGLIVHLSLTLPSNLLCYSFPVMVRGRSKVFRGF